MPNMCAYLQIKDKPDPQRNGRAIAENVHVNYHLKAVVYGIVYSLHL